LTGSSSEEITQLLMDWYGGDRSALDRLFPVVYDELRRQAHRYIVRQSDNNDLQTTALVHEVYLELQNAGKIKWQDRRHFYAISAKLMRQILVHMARERASQKRGSQYVHISLNEAIPAPEPAVDVVKLDTALDALAKIDPRKASVVELRFFGGLNLEETAEVLKVSADTVWRDWDLAKTWLWREMRDGAGNSPAESRRTKPLSET
jgi:RNA polymerase sigma-70 factor (ECF subfamily)